MAGITRNKAIHAIRWLLVAPAAVAGFLTPYLLGILLSDAYASFQPVLARGGPGDPSSDPIVQAMIVLLSAMAAGLMVLLPSLVAPSRRPLVAFAAFSFGAAIAALFLHISLYEDVAWFAFASALATGGMTAIMIRRAGNGRRFEKTDDNSC